MSALTEISTAANVIDYPGLNPDSRQMAIIAANLEGEQMNELDLVSVKTPLGGSTTWTINVDGNTETTDEIVGVLVGVGKRGLLWPQEDPSEAKPVIASTDLVVGYRISDDLGSIKPEDLEKFRIGDRRYDWQAMSSSDEFGYGSARSGSGKRCKEARTLAILREGQTWPILVTVGAGSLRNIIPFLRRLPCFQHEAVIGLKLVKAKGRGGQPYSQIVPRLVGQLTEEQGEVCRRIYADPLKQMFAAPPNGAVSSTPREDYGDE